MQLSASSGKNSLIARAYFLAFGDSLDHSTDWPLADVVVSINRWMHRTARFIWMASGTWEFDDSNQTTLPVATTTLVADQGDYTLPTTIMELQKVAILDAHGDYIEIEQIDLSELPVDFNELNGTSGMPKYYDVRGASLILTPKPATGSVTMAAGLKISVSRESVEFSVPSTYTTADTTEPGFVEDFHDILSYGAAYDWCSVNGPDDRATRYRNEIEAIHLNLSQFYGARNKDKKVGISPRREDYR